MHLRTCSAERRLQDGLGSWSDHGRIMLGLWSESSLRCDWSFHLFLEVPISWQAQHFVNLHVQISWQAQHFVNLQVQISWQAQHFVNLHAQISWQAQPFVNLQVQISWQAQYKMRFGEIADARNAVFFHRTGGFKPGKSSSAERRVRDGLGSFSDHARAWSESSLHCD